MLNMFRMLIYPSSGACELFFLVISWNNLTNKSQAPEDGCINIRNMLSIKYRNNKASDIKLVSLYWITVLTCYKFIPLIFSG